MRQSTAGNGFPSPAEFGPEQRVDGAHVGNRVLHAVRKEFATSPRNIPIDAATIIHNSPLIGARQRATAELRHMIIQLANT